MPALAAAGPASVLAVRVPVWWGGLVDAVALARCFGLGGTARLSDGPVARGKQGLVWRLDTADGRWAVKVPFHRSGEDEVRSAAAFQEAACAAGVPAPRVRRTTEGCVFATLEGKQVRMYEWVDLRAPDATLDPHTVGAVVAAIHRVPATGAPGPLHPWYHEPVGARRWDQLIKQLSGAGAPFAGRLAGLRDELVALSPGSRPRRRCGPAIATCGPTTSCRPPVAECASSTGRTAVRPTPARSATMRSPGRGRMGVSFGTKR